MTEPSPIRKAELEQPCKGITVDWKDRTKQPRCPTCGRFAYWDETIGEWMLGCVVYDYYEGSDGKTQDQERSGPEEIPTPET